MRSCATGVPYFDLSLQHVSKPLLRRMRRWGDGDRFLRRIGDIRERQPDAAFRSNFIVGYPGETEEDHDQLLRFVEQAELDWCGFFAYSREEGTYALDLDGAGRAELDERAARRAARAAGRHHRAPPRRADRLDDRGAGRRAPAWRAATARRPRSTASSRCRATLAVGRVPRRSHRRRPRARPRRRRSRADGRRASTRPQLADMGQRWSRVARRAVAPFMFVLIPDEHGRIVGRRSRCGSCCAPPMASTATSPVATARRRRRVPRSAGRQGAGARRDVRPRQQRHLLDRARRDHRRARARRSASTARSSAPRASACRPARSPR